MSLTLRGSEASGAAAALLLLLCTACGGQGPPEPPLPQPRYSIPFEVKPTVAPFTTGVVRTQAAGSFQVLEERDTTSLRDAHIPYGWTKIHLSFTTEDRRANITLEDNGTELTIIVQVPACYLYSSYHQYRDGDDEGHLYDKMARLFRHLLRTCPWQDERARDYQRQLQLARADFPAAMRVMKVRVIALFHGEKRCRRLSPDPMVAVWGVCEMD